MEKRSDFRIALENERCLLSSNIFVPEALIENISGTGMSILVPEDKLQDTIEIQFSVHGRSFARKALVEWKEASPNGGIVCGLSFMDQKDSERVYLHSVLMTEAAIAYQEKKAVGAR